MKSKWIRRDGNKMLILFFGGFACDEKILSRSCVPADCDMVMFFDYRSLDFDFDFSAYAEVSVVAWSFGVWVADFLAKKIGRTFMRVAINGSPFPVDDSFGIPVSIFEKTLSAFDERSKERFLRRVCGGSGEYSELEGLMTSRSASELRDELLFLKGAFAREKFEKKPWDTVIVARNDKIFPLENLKRVWGESAQVGEGEHLNVPIFGMAFAAVSQRVLRTRGGFDKTAETYSENAFVQRDIAATLADVLEDFAPMGDSVSNILEVGCGTGLLTYRLASRFGAAQWYLNDLSEKMCACAARALVKKPNICKGDIMLAEFDSTMDLIVSSSCFQWVPDLRSLFAKLSLVSSGNSSCDFHVRQKKLRPNPQPYRKRARLSLAWRNKIGAFGRGLLRAVFGRRRCRRILSHSLGNLETHKGDGGKRKIYAFLDAQNIAGFFKSLCGKIFNPRRRFTHVQSHLYPSRKEVIL